MRDKWTPWLWVLAAFILVSTRLTELGISLDSSLFSSVARTLSRNWDWWNPGASDSLFPEFYVHPYLGLWMQAIVFKCFGISDETARLLGVFFGSLSFYFIYRIGEILLDRRFGHVLAFLTFLTIPYVGRIPSFYFEVPLTFFMLGSFYFFLRSLTANPKRNGALSGLFLGLAFLTKGLAALPLLGAIGILAFIRYRWRTFRNPTAWLVLVISVGMMGGFCLLQHHYGKFSFFQGYFVEQFFKGTLQAGMKAGPGRLLLRFWQEHPVHIILAVGSLYVVFKRRMFFEVALVGWITTILFLIANAIVGVPNRHYFHPIYPFINILAAITFYPLAEKYKKVNWLKVCLILSLTYQVVWHVLPLHMRRKTFMDFYVFKGLMDGLKKTRNSPVKWCVNQPSRLDLSRDVALVLGYVDSDCNCKASKKRRHCVTPIIRACPAQGTCVPWLQEVFWRFPLGRLSSTERSRYESL